jgi:hypothetical protein
VSEQNETIESLWARCIAEKRLFPTPVERSKLHEILRGCGNWQMGVRTVGSTDSRSLAVRDADREATSLEAVHRMGTITVNSTKSASSFAAFLNMPSLFVGTEAAESARHRHLKSTKNTRSAKSSAFESHGKAGTDYSSSALSIFDNALNINCFRSSKNSRKLPNSRSTSSGM